MGLCLWNHLEPELALKQTLSPMEGGRFNLFMAWFFFFFAPPLLSFKSERTCLIPGILGWKSSWFRICSSLFLTKQQVALLASTVLLPKQVSRLFATGKVRVSV